MPSGAAYSARGESEGGLLVTREPSYLVFPKVPERLGGKQLVCVRFRRERCARNGRTTGVIHPSNSQKGSGEASASRMGDVGVSKTRSLPYTGLRGPSVTSWDSSLVQSQLVE